MSNHPSRNARAKPQTNGDVFNADAILDEIAEEGVPFTLHGERFICPAPSGWPDEAFDAAQNDDPVATVRAILGDDYQRFVAAGGTALTFQRITAKLHGAELGESSGSSSSSASTPSPSKQTSSASTASTSTPSEPAA